MIGWKDRTQSTSNDYVCVSSNFTIIIQDVTAKSLNAHT